MGVRRTLMARCVLAGVALLSTSCRDDAPAQGALDPAPTNVGSAAASESAGTPHDRPARARPTARIPAEPLSVGDEFACVLTPGGEVKCWGKSGLGNGNYEAVTWPQAVQGLKDVVALALGSTHNCALTARGAVLCWGENSTGQLGNDSTKNSRAPVLVTGLGSEVKAVVAGFRYTCVLTQSGEIRCWGLGFTGKESTSWVSHPVKVPGLKGKFSAISGGEGHACAIDEQGGVICWGRTVHLKSDYDQVPVRVPGLGKDAIAVAAGDRHSCALMRTGSVRCWGDNASGAVGVPWRPRKCAKTKIGICMDITDDHHRTPVTVEGIEGTVVKLVAGGARSCALTREHGVQCWGQFYGPHGRDYRFEPDRVPGIGNEEVATLAAGNHFTCVLTKSNRVKCWGFHAELDKNVGQRNSEAPVLVPGL